MKYELLKLSINTLEGANILREEVELLRLPYLSCMHAISNDCVFLLSGHFIWAPTPCVRSESG